MRPGRSGPNSTPVTRQNRAWVRLAPKLRGYWALIKSLQTFLLLVTGLAGYLSARSDILPSAPLRIQSWIAAVVFWIRSLIVGDHRPWNLSGPFDVYSLNCIDGAVPGTFAWLIVA